MNFTKNKFPSKIYTDNSKADVRNVNILNYLLPEDYFMSFIQAHDKIPNQDGKIELLYFPEGHQLGEVEVQVKSMRKDYSKPSISIDIGYFTHIIESHQRAFILIAVDRNRECAYWKHLTIEYAKMIYIKYNNQDKHQKTVAIQFDENNIIDNQKHPYEEWKEILDKSRGIASGELINRYLKVNYTKSDNLLESIHNYLEKLHSKLLAIPPSLISYSDSPLNGYYYDNFSLRTRDINVFHFFNELVTDGDTIWIGGEEVKDETNLKLKFILKCLKHNLIYQIIHSNKIVDLRSLFEKIECDCTRCSINKGNLPDKLSYFKDEPVSIEGIMEFAYEHYRIGNYFEAILAYVKAKEIAVLNDDFFRIFLINFNLNKLKKLQPIGVNNEKYSKKVIDELNTINPDQNYRDCLDTELFSIVFKIYNDNQFSFLGRQIQKELNIVKKAHNKIVNGHSNKQISTGKIVNLCAELESFAGSNGIIFRRSQEYSESINAFTEAWYLKNASGLLNKRINHFESWALTIIFHGATTEHLLSIFRYYKFKSLNPNFGGNHNDKSHLEMLLNALKQYDSNLEFVNRNWNKNKWFVKNQRSLARKAIILVAHLELKNDFILQFSVYVKEYIISKCQYSELEYFREFVNLKGDVLSDSFYKDIVIDLIQNDEPGGWWAIIEYIWFYYNSQNRKLILTEDEFDIIRVWSEQCDTSNNLNGHMTCLLHCIIDNVDFQFKVKSSISNQLKEFNFDLFYSANIFGVIELSDKHLKKAIEYIGVRIRNKKITSINENEDIEIREIEEMYNLCFKMNIEIKKFDLPELMTISNYYLWLYDMKLFDYNLFNPNWVTRYDTKFFYRRMYACDQLRNHLESKIRNGEGYHSKRYVDTYLLIFMNKSFED